MNTRLKRTLVEMLTAEKVTSRTLVEGLTSAEEKVLEKLSNEGAMAAYSGTSSGWVEIDPAHDMASLVSLAKKKIISIGVKARVSHNEIDKLLGKGWAR